MYLHRIILNHSKEGNSVTNNKATSSTVTGSISPRRSCRKVKPSSLSDDSTYVNTLDTSLIPSDQEDHVNNTTHKKKKKKVKNTYVYLCYK